MSIHVNTFANNHLLVEVLSQQIALALRLAIAQRGRASIAVSGGSTPISLFVALSQIAIEWEKVTICLIDERWVSPSHEDSNELLVRQYLLTGLAAKAKFVGLKTSAAQPSASIKPLSAILFSQVLPLDIAVLGMGEDGHTASFFSGADTFLEALNPELEAACVVVKPPVAPHLRMTLSLASILSSKRLFLHFLGERKMQVFEQARQGLDVNRWPVSAILSQTKIDVDVFYASH